jgi:uncharacterized membrane protein
MKRALPTILDTVHTLALACWLFGLLVIVAIVAPAAAHLPGETSLQVGRLVAESLYRFGTIVWICGLLMLGAQFVLRRRYRRDRALFIGDGVRQLLTFGTLLLAEHCRDVLIPTLQAAGNAGNAPKFDHFQHLIVSVTLLQIVLLIAIGALTAWLQWPRPVAAPVSAPSTTPQKPAAAPSSSRRTTR